MFFTFSKICNYNNELFIFLQIKMSRGDKLFIEQLRR